MTKEHDQMLALVDHLQNYGCRSECEMHEDREDAADALTALLDRTAKTEADRDYNRRDAEHLRNVVDRLNAEIDRLREALFWYEKRVSDCRKNTNEGTNARQELHMDCGGYARAALKGSGQ